MIKSFSILRDWEDLPEKMKNECVRKYYDILAGKKCNLFIKRTFDVVVSFVMLIIFIPLFLVVSIVIKLDSSGPVLFCQERVTRYGRLFCIYKFRTMVIDQEGHDEHITSKNDSRITKVGRVLRKYRIDETPQLINILLGHMSFVGPRPEVKEFVASYTPEMLATLLVPAGVTSETSIKYKNEETIIKDAENIDQVYIEKILPMKMMCNLESIAKFSLFGDLKTMFRTIIYVFRKDTK